MSDKKAVYSLSISGRATLDMHSLNNEGGEGNQITTRMVNIITQDGKLATVNAISGDMFKHIQAEHLQRIGKEKLALCAACQRFDANRIAADPAFIKAVEGKSSSQVIDTLLQMCALDDLEGNLITAGKRSVPRKSVAEFAWVVGLPELTTTDSYFHVKYVSERDKGDAAGADQSANLGQNIFYRPASSGIYAIVACFEMARIGFNDITQAYPIGDEERQKRYAAFLESILYTFVQPNGAMRNTQNPHIVNFEGVIAVSNQVVPAPTISPLNDKYPQEIEGIKNALDTLHPGAVTLYPFASMSTFAQVMTDLTRSTSPFKMVYK
jgi:CRISPR-associated protein Cst2